MTASLTIRPATPADVPQLLAFIRDMAVFEKLRADVDAVQLHNALFGQTPAAYALIIDVDGAPAGYAVYYFTFSTLLGQRGLWLEDIFLAPAWRGRGIGKVVMAHLAGIAHRENCARFEWIVLDWNETAIGLYTRLGATVLPDWRICRLDASGIAALAA